MLLSATDRTYAFLQGNGEMATLTRSFDWSATSLGPPDRWPLSLRTTLGLLLHSAFPMFLFWGDDLLCFYNDAYRPSLGENGKHPALGKPAREVWPEIWDFIGPMIEQVITTGEPTWFEDQLVPIFRNGQMEDVYWTFSYSPAYNDDGRINGVLVTCTETTQKVISIQELRKSDTELNFAIDAAELGVWDVNPRTNQLTTNARLKDWFGLSSDKDIPLSLALDIITNTDRPRVVAAIEQALRFESGGRYDIEYTIQNPQTGQARVVRARGKTQFDDDRRPYRFNGTLQDITELKRAERRQALLLKLSDTLRPLSDPEDVQFKAARVLGEALNANRVGYAEVQPDGETVLVTQNYVNGVFGIEGRHRFDDFGPELLESYSVGRSVIRSDAPNDPSLTDAEKIAHAQINVKAAANVPFMREGRLVAVLFAHFRDAHVWSDDEIDLIKEVAERTWDAVERARAETAQRTSEAYFRRLTDTAPAILWITEPDGTCSYLNQQWYAYTGQTPAQAEGFGWLDATHPDDKAEAGRLFLEANTRREPFKLLYRLRYHDGTYRWAIDQAAPRFSADGTFEGMVGTVLDVHDQFVAEQDLQTSETKLRTLIASAPVAIGLFVGRDLIIELPNQTFIDIVGRGPDIAGKPLREVMPELERQPFLQILNDVFTTGQPFANTGAPVQLSRDGVMETRYFNVAFTPLHNDDGEIYAVLDVSVDVTEQVLAQQELAQQKTYLQNALDIADLGTFTMNVEMGSAIVSENTQRWFGLSATTDTVENILSRIHPGDLPNVQSVITNALSSEEHSQYEVLYRVIHPANNEISHIRSFGKTEFQAGVAINIRGLLQNVTPQMQARQELARQKAFLQNAIDIADLGTFDIDVASQTGLFNENVCQWFGLPSQHQPVERMADHVHPDDRLMVLQTLAENIQDEARSRHDMTYRIINGKDGRVHYLRSLGKALFSNGKPQTISGIVQNVTPQVQARQALEQSEQNLRALVESAPFPIGVYVGREMRIALANQSIIKVFGKGDDVIGKRYAELLPELADQQIFEQLDHVYTTGEAFHAKTQRVDIVVDGNLQPYYFKYSFTPLYNANGEVYGVMNTAAELTDLVVAKQQVEEAEAALREAIELAELVTWDMDIKRGVITYSPRFMEWLGFSEDTKALDEAYNPLPGAYRESVPAALEAVWQSGGSGFYDNEHPVVNRLTGQVRLIHAQARLVLDDDGQPAFLRGTAQDVTEQRRVQQELERQVAEQTQQLRGFIHDLERSNQNLQQFAYVASHDLQEPLRKIQSFGDILAEQYSAQLGDGMLYLQRMQQSASRMSVLIRDLLTYSRISTQQDTSDIVNLNDVVKTTLNDLDLMISEAGANVAVERLPTVQGDASQLGQLFQNLLNNALKFRRPDVAPTIQITCQLVPATDLPDGVRPSRPADTYYRVDVADNGIGFDEKYADRIFQVFQRLHGRNQYVGTGIGLAICEKVAANHGGAIAAHSQPNQGATFSVYLPKA